MKAQKIVWRDIEDNAIHPRVVYAKILNEDDDFICFLSGKGRTYRVNKMHIISIEESDREFMLQEATG